LTVAGRVVISDLSVWDAFDIVCGFKRSAETP
jgi:hypothetical protein